MNKIELYTVLAAGLAGSLFTSCSNDEPIENVNGSERATSEITFRAGLGTRAFETTNANLNSIYITAIHGLEKSPYFENALYNREENGSIFTCGQKYTWLTPELGHEDDLAYHTHFFSYNDERIKDHIVIKNEFDDEDWWIWDHEDPFSEVSRLRIEDYTMPAKMEDQFDLVTAVVSGAREANERNGVELNFRHAFAQMEVKVKSKSPEYEVDVLGFKIANIYNKGSYDFVRNFWVLTLEDEDNATYEEIFSEPIRMEETPLSLNEYSGHGNLMMMNQGVTGWDIKADPYNKGLGKYIAVLVKITRKENGYRVYPYPNDDREYAWTAVPINGTWFEGTRYVYTLDFTKGAGNVAPDDPNPSFAGLPVISDEVRCTVSVEEWGEYSEDPSVLNGTPDLDRRNGK